MRHLEPVAVHGQQAAADEGLDHLPARAAALAVQVQLGERHRPPHERPAVVDVGEPHEQAAGQLPPGVVQRAVGGLGRPGERAGDAAGLQVAGEREPVAAAPLPGADQRRRQQRQRARPAQDVGDDGVEQLGIRPSGRPSAAGSRTISRSSASVSAGTSTSAPPSRSVNAGVLRQPPDVVAAHDRDAAGDDPVVDQPEDGVEEGGALRRVDPGRPQLLELVADEQDRTGRRRVAR